MNNFIPAHLADLKKSGLSDATIEQTEIHTVMPPRQINTKSSASTIPGLSSMYEIPTQTAMAFPASGFFMRTVKTARNTYRGGHLQPSLHSPSCCFHPVRSDKTAIFYGRRKEGVKSLSDGLPCIGLSGLWSWKEKGKSIIPDFDTIIFKRPQSVYRP